MAKNIDDRRARRSRRLLKEGLLQLMKKTRFSEITAKNITDLMDMNRSTFYLHYKGTIDLLQSLEDDLEAEVQELIDAHIGEMMSTESIRPVFEPVLDYITEHLDTCTILFNNNEASNLTGRLQKLIYRNGVEIIRAGFNPESEEQMHYLLNFVTFGMLGLLETWFTDEKRLPKEELMEMADLMLSGAAHKFFDQEK